MLGISIERRNILGTTLRFSPGWSKFITNRKGLGMSIMIQSPIEFHITIPSPRRKYK
jgi:hypothetical protein